MAAAEALSKTVNKLEKQVGSLNGANFAAISNELKKIAAPKFQWDEGLRQADLLTSKIKAGKLSVTQYIDAWKNGAKQIADQQARISRATSTPMGNGIHAMSVPTTASIESSVSSIEKLNRVSQAYGEILGGLGTKVQDWGKNTQWAGRQLSVGLTVPFTMAAAAAGKYALDVDKAMVHIEKVYDGSTKGLRDNAMQVSMDITKRLGVSVKSSLDVMGELAAAGKQGQEMMQLTTEAQRLSALGNIDQAESIKAVISMQSIWKMSTEDVAKSVNYLNAVEAATPTNLQDLVDSIPIAGAMVAQLGGTLKDTTILLTAFKERGISTVEGANAIKTAMNRILNPTEPAKKTFLQQTGQDLDELVKKAKGDPLQVFQALSDAIMGGNIALEDQQRVISKVVGIYQSSRITGLLQGLQDKNGAVNAAKALSQKTDAELAGIAKKHEEALTHSASGQFTIAVESFKAQLQAFGQFAIQLATKIIKGFSGVMDFFNKLPEPLKWAALLLGGMAALAGPLLMIVGLVGNLIGSVMKAGAWFMTIGKGYKTMTLEEKAAELQSKALNGAMLTQAQTTQLLIYNLDKLQAAYTGMNAAAAQSMITKGAYTDFDSLKKKRDDAMKQEKDAAARLAELDAARTKLLNDPSKVTKSSSFAGGMIFRAPSGREQYNQLNTEIATQQAKLTAAINERKNAVTAAINAETAAMSASLKEQAMSVRAAAIAAGKTEAQVVTAAGQSFKQDAGGRWQKFNTDTGKFGGFASRDDQKALKEGWNSVAVATDQVAGNVDKAGKFQKVFNQNVGFGLATVTGIAGMAAESGSSFEKWMNYISLAAIGLTTIGPLLGTIGNKVKGMKIVENILGSASGGGVAGKLKGLTSGIGGMVSKMFGPMGLAIGAGIAGVTALFSIITAKQQEQREYQNNLNNSTDVWVSLLGKSRIQWGQIKDASGQVKDTVDSLAASLRASEDPKTQALLKSLRESKGTDLFGNSMNEVFRMQGQGFNATEIEKSLRAALTAAGKSLKEQDDIWAQIKVRLSFDNAKGDLDSFAKDSAAKFKDTYSKALQDRQGFSYAHQGDQYSMATEFSGKFMPDIQREAQTIVDRFANLDGVDRKVAVQQMADSIGNITKQSFDELKKRAPGQFAGSYDDAIKSMLTYDDKNHRYFADAPKMRNEGKDGNYISNAQDLAKMTNAELDLARAIGQAMHLSDEQINKINSMKDIVPLLSNANFTATQVQEAYNKAVNNAASSGNALTDAEKTKLAQTYATIFGLDAAKLSTNGYAQSTEDATKKIQENAKALQAFIPALKDAANAADDFWQEQANPGTDQGSGFGGLAQQMLGSTSTDQAKALTDRVKGIYSGTMDQIYQSYSDSAAEIWQQRLDNISAGFEKKKKAVQASIDQFDKNYQAKQQAWSDNWDTVMDSSKKSFDNRQKAIENEAQAQLDGIDAQIDAIKTQQDAEDELEKQRQKSFDAEKKRIERLAELANRNIDYNKALYGGNLDEAARVQNNTESLTVGWAIDDSDQAAQDKADDKSKMNDKQIKQLESTKELVNRQKQAKLDALKEEEEATTKSLEKQREAERRSMEASKEIERERMQAHLDSLNQQQQAAEATERKKQEIQRRTLDIQLATLKAFIPQNEQQLNDHINRVGAAYGQFGLGLQGAGSQWGQIVGNALQNNVDIARQQMSSDANWAAFGAQVAGAISQGAFGLSLQDFMNLLRTGNPPAGWTPPSATPKWQNSANGTTFAPSHGPAGGFAFRHAGGPVDDSPGSRNGLSGGLQSSEIPMILQRGEFVINKDAVNRLGTQNLNRINAGNPKAFEPGANLAGIGGMIAATMAGTMVQMATNNIGAYYAGQNANIAMALGYMQAGLMDAVTFAQAQDGKPYIWGSAGPAGYDCSGYMSAIANVLTGAGNPYKRVFATGQVTPGAPFGPFVPGGGGPFEIGVKHGNPGHTAGTLAGVNVESTGNHVRYAKDAHGARDKQFNMLFHIPPENIATGSWTGTGGSEGMSGVRAIVQQVAASRGWGGGLMWESLDWLISHESSWNPNAQNPNSTAYGLFQFLNSTWAGYGIPKTSDPRLQAEAGMRYIASRYGNPLGAKSFWQTHHWYDSGGDLMPGFTNMYNGTNQVETVLTNGTTRAVVRALENANFSYDGFKDVLRDFTIPAMSGTSFDNPNTNTYNYDINIDGSGLSAKELKTTIKEVIEETHIRADKKRGLRK